MTDQDPRPSDLPASAEELAERIQRTSFDRSELPSPVMVSLLKPLFTERQRLVERVEELTHRPGEARTMQDWEDGKPSFCPGECDAKTIIQHLEGRLARAVELLIEDMGDGYQCVGCQGDSTDSREDVEHSPNCPVAAFLADSTDPTDQPRTTGGE